PAEPRARRHRRHEQRRGGGVGQRLDDHAEDTRRQHRPNGKGHTRRPTERAAHRHSSGQTWWCWSASTTHGTHTLASAQLRSAASRPAIGSWTRRNSNSSHTQTTKATMTRTSSWLARFPMTFLLDATERRRRGREDEED